MISLIENVLSIVIFDRNFLIIDKVKTSQLRVKYQEILNSVWLIHARFHDRAWSLKQEDCLRGCSSVSFSCICYRRRFVIGQSSFHVSCAINCPERFLF